MTNPIIKTTKLILLTLLFNIHSSDTEVRTDYIMNLNRLKYVFTNNGNGKNIGFGSTDIETTDLNEIKLERPLDKLTLKDDAVYLLRYISADETKDTHIKELTLESYKVDTDLENIVKEQNAKKSGLKSVDEITGEGIVAITEILTGMSFDSNKPVKVLSLITCRTIDLERIQRIPDNDTIFCTELKIAGLISPKILKSIYEKYGKNTEILRINYSPNFAMWLQCEDVILEQGDYTEKYPKLKTLILEDGAILFLFTKQVKLFEQEIEEDETDKTDKIILNIILNISSSLETGFIPEDSQDLPVCDNLELHNKAIIVLPLISNASLERIDKIKTKYRKTDVSLKGIISDPTELAACEKVLKDNASDELRELDLSAKKSGLLNQKTEKRLTILFGMTLHADV